MKRDLLFVVERLAAMLDERKLEIVARNRSLKKTKDGDSAAKLLSAYIRKTEESELGRLLVEMVMLQSAQTQLSVKALQEAAATYKIDTNAIAAKVKQESAVKEKAQTAKKTAAKAKPVKRAKAA